MGARQPLGLAAPDLWQSLESIGKEVRLVWRSCLATVRTDHRTCQRGALNMHDLPLGPVLVVGRGAVVEFIAQTDAQNH